MAVLMAGLRMGWAAYGLGCVWAGLCMGWAGLRMDWSAGAGTWRVGGCPAAAVRADAGSKSPGDYRYPVHTAMDDRSRGCRARRRGDGRLCQEARGQAARANPDGELRDRSRRRRLCSPRSASRSERVARPRRSRPAAALASPPAAHCALGRTAIARAPLLVPPTHSPPRPRSLAALAALALLSIITTLDSLTCRRALLADPLLPTSAYASRGHQRQPILLLSKPAGRQ